MYKHKNRLRKRFKNSRSKTTKTTKIENWLKIIYTTFIFISFVVIELKFGNKKINNKKNEDVNFDMNLFQKKIEEKYQKEEFVNLNDIESQIKNGRKWTKNINKQNEINIGFQLDPYYVLRAMITLTSIMDSQKSSTKIRFHFGVVLNFSVADMLKIYTLRKKIREDVEFNFYNAKRVETELKGLNTKGPGAVAKMLLPQLLPDDVNRLLVFDTGDLLVIKDLSEAYNWDMKGCLYAGVPAGSVGNYAKISKKIYDIFISVGSFLIDVKKVKEENMYEKFRRYKNQYSSAVGDQDLFNDVAFGNITYFPFKFGMISPYSNDYESEKAKKQNMFLNYVQRFKYEGKFDFIPKNEEEFLKMGYSPSVIHHMHSKWMFGSGLTVYRRLAQYYIKYAGIWDEICKEFPGYCKK